MIKENSIRFTPTKSVGSPDITRLQLAVHGALDVFNMRNPDQECWFEIDTEYDHVELKITGEFERTGTRTQLYSAMIDICASVFLLLPNTSVEGAYKLEDGRYIHCVEANERGLACYCYTEIDGGAECKWEEMKEEVTRS